MYKCSFFSYVYYWIGYFHCNFSSFFVDVLSWININSPGCVSLHFYGYFSMITDTISRLLRLRSPKHLRQARYKGAP